VARAGVALAGVVGLAETGLDFAMLAAAGFAKAVAGVARIIVDFVGSQ